MMYMVKYGKREETRREEVSRRGGKKEGREKG